MQTPIDSTDRITAMPDDLGRGSSIGTILEIHQGEPGRTHVVLIRQAVGF